MAGSPVRASLPALARLALLLLAAVLGPAVTAPSALLWLLPLAGCGAWAAAAPRAAWAAAGRFAEVVVAALAAAGFAAGALSADPGGAALAAAVVLPYLSLPVATATYLGRPAEGGALLGTGVLALGLAALFTPLPDGPLLTDRWFLVLSAQAVLIAALAGAVVGVVRGGAAAEPAAPAPPAPYEEATRLLTQLRSVARQLPGATLDPGSIAEHMLDDVKNVARTDRAAVLTASGGGRLVVLTESGVDRAEWEATIDSDSALAEAWASQQPQTSGRSQTRSHAGGDVSALIVPLIAGVRTVGLMVIEAAVTGAYPAEVVEKVTAITAPAALRLEAALLFDEVRSIATNEERQRLAREIHDGVAQELVIVGYGIDNALATLPEGPGADDTAETMRMLRGEVTRVITELRLSLFELRSEVDRHGGLAAALAEYARTVAASAGLRVHLSLDESTNRLPAATEAELLRIGQEAITNARKHAAASNLWVTCEVDPPYARVEVADDGKGLPERRPDGRYGLTIMRERTNRVRGRLEITPRDPNGTSVAVVVGTPPRRDSVRDSVNAAETE
ncbi:GAF domain-containing sensor histidine kinase [Pilimelia terevasa]|uniref:GAF domain-containing sensor histidine kinase n=1 Tax=Pilimelia terevasa TaxID=53372 RepID=UPI00166ED0D6|nr:GAF domain-containing sensor histidine kinase [Pilimelia terevasa]